jgi:hypothetical protein
MLVTHDSTVARRAQRIGVMKNGRLTFKQPSRRKATASAPLAAEPPTSSPQLPVPNFQSPDLPPAASIPATDPTDSVSFPE